MAQKLLIERKNKTAPIFQEVHNDAINIHADAESTGIVFLTLSGSANINATLEADSNLTIVCVQTEEADIKQSAQVASNANIYWQNVSLGPVQHTLRSTLSGDHAISNIDWIFCATGTEKQKLNAVNVFNGKHGGGETTMKGVAQDSAHTECNGSIEIGLNGGGMQTYLTEDVLMLDRTAVVHAIPGLEIKTNDVKASHSATISKVTDEDLFYFASRGIEEATARTMYVRGFLEELTEKITDKEVRTRVLEAIEAKC